MRSVLFFASLIFIAAFSTVVSTAAFAAGYSCVSVDRDTRVLVEMEAADLGQAKRMVFIDPTLSARSQTIAVFSAESGQLSSQVLADGQRFVSTVAGPIEHPGKHLGGTKVGLLASVIVDVQTITERLKVQTLSEGAMFAAEVSYVKKTGDTLKQDFDCALFLGDSAPEINLDN